ncbi:MAG: DUF6504 family protein [Verrucomicrobiota bacterium]|nr:DUF6504 family protein [Verrucomicrobiota bacterium]
MTTPPANETLLSAPLKPVDTSDVVLAQTVGEPILPRQFQQGKEVLTITSVMEKWKESEVAGCGDRYVRKHWYKVQIEDGRTAKLYCLRKADSRASAKQRWWLYSVENPLP